MEYISPAPTVIQSPALVVSAAPAPVDEYVAPAPAVSAAPAPVDEYVASALAVSAAPAPVDEYVAPAPAVSAAPAPVEEYVAPAPAVSAAPAPVEEYIAPAPAVSAAPAPVEEYIAPAPAVSAAPAPSVEYTMPAPAVYAAQAPVAEYLAPAPSVFQAPTPRISPVPLVHTAPAPVVDFIAPSARTQFFSLSPASSDPETHFPVVTGTKSRRGIETLCRDAALWTRPGTCFTCRWSGSCVLLWRAWGTSGDARKREKQLAGTLLHLSHELQSCPSHGHAVTLLGLLAGGRGPNPAPSAIAGVVSRMGSLERSVEFWSWSGRGLWWTVW